MRNGKLYIIERAYLGPCQKCTMKKFGENSYSLFLETSSIADAWQGPKCAFYWHWKFREEREPIIFMRTCHYYLCESQYFIAEFECYCVLSKFSTKNWLHPNDNMALFKYILRNVWFYLSFSRNVTTINKHCHEIL